MKNVKIALIMFAGCIMHQTHGGGPAGMVSREIVDTTAGSVGRNVSREAGEIAHETAQVAGKSGFVYHGKRTSQPREATDVSSTPAESQMESQRRAAEQAKTITKEGVKEVSEQKYRKPLIETTTGGFRWNEFRGGLVERGEPIAKYQTPPSQRETAPFKGVEPLGSPMTEFDQQVKEARPWAIQQQKQSPAFIAKDTRQEPVFSKQIAQNQQAAGENMGINQPPKEGSMDKAKKFVRNLISSGDASTSVSGKVKVTEAPGTTPGQNVAVRTAGKVMKTHQDRGIEEARYAIERRYQAENDRRHQIILRAKQLNQPVPYFH